ncbi:MAG: hypothetical protein ACK4RN_09755 [Pseudorhodobacter sp.]
MDVVDAFVRDHVGLLRFSKETGVHHIRLRRKLDAADIRPIDDPERLRARIYRREDLQPSDKSPSDKKMYKAAIVAAFFVFGERLSDGQTFLGKWTNYGWRDRGSSTGLFRHSGQGSSPELTPQTMEKTARWLSFPFRRGSER